MTGDSPNDLNFGHFGIPAYDLDHSQWAFVRAAYGSSFRQLGHWKAVIPAAVHFPSPCVPRTLRTAQHAAKSIVRDHPELVPAAQQLPEFEAVSAAATAALNTYDATIGQQISFGSITPLKKGRGFTRQVAALPAGEGGNILRLQLLVKEQHGWKEEERNRPLCCLEGLSLKGDCGFWNEDAAAIQQVCFAQSEDPGSFLAVRLPRRIALFRPVYNHRFNAAAKSPLYDLPPSVLDIRPFHSVWTEDTGGASHADVAFNPHYQRQFAIVDQDWSWSVWDIDGNRRSYTVKPVASGSMTIKEDFDSDEQAETVRSRREDGWARIMWVGDANTILICNRRQLELIDLKGSTRSLRIPQVIDWSSTKNPSGHWILDIRRHPTNEKQFFILTSVRLYLFARTSVSDQSSAEFHDADAAVILSWTHFRDAEDVSLQLHVQSISDDETVVFVHSRLNVLITVYRLVDQPLAAMPCRSFGPSTLRLDSSDKECRSKLILNFDIAQLNFKDSGTGPRGSGHVYNDRGVRFHQLSAVFNDLSVAQTMLCSLGPEAWEIPLEDIEPTSWVKVVRPPALTALSNDIISSDEDDFVEPDGLIDVSGPLLKPVYRQPQLLNRKTTEPARDAFNFSSLYENLVSNKSMLRGIAKASPETMDISALIEEIKWRLDREENVTPFTLGTVQEYAEAIVTVDDIDEASTRLQELFLAKRASALELRRIVSDRVLGFMAEETQEPLWLSSVYDLLLQNWVAPLPGTIPARIRQCKELMARRIATGVVLASTRVRNAKDGENLTATQPGPSQDSAVALSLSLPQYSSQSEWQSQSSLPGDSDDLVSLSASAAISSDPLERLSRHLHISNPKPPEIPPSINQVLSHWPLGADPSIYDWEATERAFAEEFELEQEGTQKRREKALRKKERQAKRQKRENELYTGRVESGLVESQLQMLRSSPGPALAAGSSQVPAPSQSQPFGVMLGVQSQVEPGRHGGRPVKKKKVKGRMSGF